MPSFRKNIFEGLKKDASVFKDERFLYPEFVPDRLSHREKELENLASAFSPITKGKKPHHVFLTGPTGVGKTTAAKFVLKEMEEFTDRAKSLYLNCFEFNSRHSVLSSITNFLGMASPRRGIATDEIYTSLLEALNKASFSPLVVLDEVDQLFLQSDGQKLLYDLLRVVEFGKTSFGIVLISNNQNLTLSLDERIRSSLSEEKIIFDSYTAAQLKDIFSERASLAFLPGTLGKEVLPFVAARCARLGGDCRVGIEALLKAGRMAEKQNSQKILLEHAKAAFEAVQGVSLLKGIKYLSKPERVLLLLLAKNEDLTSGKIFSEFSEKSSSQLSERRVRDLLNDLEKKGFVSSTSIEMGNKGKTRSFSCELPKDLLLKELAKV